MYQKIIVILFFILIQNPAYAEYSKDKVFDLTIASQPLSQAIEELKSITSLEVIFLSDDAYGVKSTDVSGKFTAEQAISTMLDGTDLQLITLSQVGSFGIKKYSSENSLHMSDQIAYQQVNTETNKNTSDFETQSQTANIQLKSEESIVELNSISVTGSRIKATNIISPIPTISIGREQIDSSGTVDLGELVEEIPGVYQGISPSSSLLSTQNSGLSTINLRALGTNRTLTLINGRRVVSNSGSAQRVDTATIPSGFIDYIDITTGGASAAYGSDAIAGVANIILKNDFVGFEFGGRYEDSHDGGRETTSADITWGTDFSDRRGNIMIGANYENKEALLATDRDYALNNLEIDLETGELEPNNSSFLPGGRFEVGDAWNIDGQWQNDQDGSIYCIDDGRDPLCDDYQEALDGFNFRPFSMLFPERKRFSIMSNIKYELTDTLIATSLLQYSESDNLAVRAAVNVNDSNTFGPFDDQSTIGDISPDNPFIHEAVLETLSGTVDWRRRFVELGLRDRDSNRKTTRISFGLDGQFNDNWYWNSYVGHGIFKHHQEKHNEVNYQNIQFALNVEEDPSSLGNFRCINEAARANGCVPLNVFGVGSVSTSAADYIRHTIILDQKLTQTTGSFVINGTLKELPYGSLNSAFGIDYRRESQVATGDPITNAGLSSSSSLIDIDASMNVTEAFAEFHIPLLKDKKGINSLDATAALRIADYNTIGNVASWNFGISYAPTEDLRFRAQISQAQRAPDITELFSPQRSDFDSFNDPCDGITADSTGTIAENCRTNAGIANAIAAEGEFIQDGSSIFGPALGNPNLIEETADTLTFGFVYNPEAYDDFSFTADYYKIEIEDAIGTVDSQLAGELCYSDAVSFLTNRFCDSITRDIDGQVSRIINQSENLNSLISEGIDVTINYDFSFPNLPGKFKSNLVYAYIMKNEESFNGPNGEEIDDFAGEVGLPEREYRFRLNYINNKHTISYKLKYTGSVKDDNDPAPEDIFGFITFDSVMVHDLYYSYRFDNQHPIRFYVGIKNLTDENGPYLPDGYNSGTNFNVSSAYDRVGRRYYAGFDVSW